VSAKASPELEQFLAASRAAVDAELTRLLADRADDDGDPGRLREAMRYAVLGGGKRLRPAIVLGAAQAIAGPERAKAALPAAAAVELLHAYTLVHDDLPAMDDDQLRRGQPTVHVAFGEATAILAGDGLLTLAFGALASLGAHAADAVAVLAARAGARGLLAGQCRDLAAETAAPTSLAALERIHAEKTGALFAAAAELGAIAVGADARTRAALGQYGLVLGIAFQHADDLDDGDQPTFAADARRRLGELAATAHAALAPLPGADPLRWLMGHVRDHVRRGP
jgi:geranylgeranyl pyrophosphate synthase